LKAADLSASNIRRVVGAISIEELLMPKSDLTIPVWLPKDFLEFAQQTLADAYRDVGLNRIFWSRQ